MVVTAGIDYGTDKKWLDVLKEPLRYSISEKENAFTYIRHNFMSILATNDVFEADLDTFVELLKSDDLYVDSEIKVFECVKQWIHLSKTNPMDVLGKLIQAVRLVFLPTKYLIDEVFPYVWLVDGCRPYFSEALHWKFSSDSKMESERTRPRKNIQRSRYVMAFSSNIVQMYDIDQNKWQTMRGLDLSKSLFGAYTLMNDRLIIAGGHQDDVTLVQVDEVNLLTRKIRPLASMNEPRMEFGLVTHGKGEAAKIYAIGGALRKQDEGLNTVERYDPIANKWTYVSPMISKRHAFGAAVHGNDIYVIGGRSNGKSYKHVEVYHINEDKWESKAELNHGRFYSNAVVIGDFLYALGGSSGSYSTDLISSVERYDIHKNKWTTIANISSSGWVGVCAIDNSPVAIGGRESDVMESYDSEKNEWKKLASLDRKVYVDFAFQVPSELSHIRNVWV